MSGGQTLPDELYTNSVANVMVERTPTFRTLQFSGYTWNVKASDALLGPGPNYFSDRTEDIWIDESGYLRLKIVAREGKWFSTEVFTTIPFGYGTYTFTLASPVDQLDPNVVLGLFTYDDTAPEQAYRELDIEFSRWGETAGLNAQFVVQPWTNAGNRHRFNLDLQTVDSTHVFAWRADQIQFTSYRVTSSFLNLNEPIESWLYTGIDVPPAGIGKARINLWLLNGNPPANGQEVEVIIKSFKMSP